MKISDATFDHLLKSALKDKAMPELVVEIFESKGEAYTDGQYVLTPPVYKELMKIAEEVDPDYECLYKEGEDADVTLSFHDGVMEMYTRLAGDQAPYAEDEDWDEEEDEDYGFDAIGEWSINPLTKEVEFAVTTET